MSFLGRVRRPRLRSLQSGCGGLATMPLSQRMGSSSRRPKSPGSPGFATFVVSAAHLRSSMNKSTIAPERGGGLTACCCHLVRCLARGVSLRRRAAFHAAAVPFLPAVATHSCRSSHSPLTGPSSPYRLIWRGPGGVSPRGCGTAPGGFPQAAWRRRRVALPSLRGTAGQPPSACRHSRGTRGRRHSPRASPPTLR